MMELQEMMRRTFGFCKVLVGIQWGGWLGPTFPSATIIRFFIGEAKDGTDDNGHIDSNVQEEAGAEAGDEIDHVDGPESSCGSV